MDKNLLECTIQGIVNKYPETMDIFTGFNIVTQAELAQGLGAVLRLKTILNIKKINPASFISLLVDKIEDAEQYRQLSEVVTDNQGVFNFVNNCHALLTCRLTGPCRLF